MGECIGAYVDTHFQRYRVKYVEILMSLGLSIHNSTYNDSYRENRVPIDSPYILVHTCMLSKHHHVGVNTIHFVIIYRHGDEYID